MIDFYHILNLENNASVQQIKQAYRKLAQQYHPDRNRGADAEEKMKLFNEIKNTLLDDKKRKEYDAQLESFIQFKQRSEREARQRSEREARQRSEREARERSEREARERSEREARQRSEREARERSEREARQLNSRIKYIFLFCLFLFLSIVTIKSFFYTHADQDNLSAHKTPEETEQKIVQTTAPETEQKIVQATVPETEQKIVQATVPETEQKIVQATVPKTEQKIVQATVPETEQKIVKKNSPSQAYDSTNPFIISNNDF